jgi:hypothetical protein
LPLTIAVTPARFHPRLATRITFAAGLVTMGFFVGVIPEGNIPVSSIPSSRSLVFGVFSSLSIAVHSVLVKSSLSYCNNSTIQLAYWTNAGSAILLAPFVLLHGEPAKIAELIATSEWKMNVFAVGSLVTGSFGFLLCVAGLLSIKVTSPITHMFSSVRSHPSHFSCPISHHSPLGCSLCDTDALGGLAIWGPVDYVRHIFHCILVHSHVEQKPRNIPRNHSWWYNVGFYHLTCRACFISIVLGTTRGLRQPIKARLRPLHKRLISRHLTLRVTCSRGMTVKCEKRLHFRTNNEL